jgi:hypothetical protein
MGLSPRGPPHPQVPTTGVECAMPMGSAHVTGLVLQREKTKNPFGVIRTSASDCRTIAIYEYTT